MTYLHLFYYYLSWLFLLVSSSTFSLGTGRTELTTIDSVSSRSDHTSLTLHKSADSKLAHQPSVVPRQGDHTSNQTTMNITHPSQITTRAQWHAWFDQRRERLRFRLKQAEEAEWNWPCTRRRCEIMRIQDEIEELNAEEFVVPF